MTEVILLLLFMGGILVLYLPELGDLWRIMRFRILQWKESFQMEEGWLQSRKESYQQKLPEYIRRLLQVTLSAGTRKGVRYFFHLSVSSGAVMFLFMICQASLFTAAGASAAAAVMPYLLLRCMVQEKQVAGSHEGEILVTEILNNYKIHYCNMVTAIEVTAVTMEGAPYCRQLLFNLSRGLNRMSGNRDLELLMEEFRFALGTSWAGILSENMFLACSSGIRVTESLSDLAKSMERARQVEEFSQRENNEGRLILRYLVPGSCILLTAGGIRFFGLTVEEWFYYQFRTSTGLTWAVLFLLTCLVALAAQSLLSRRKFDL